MSNRHHTTPTTPGRLAGAVLGKRYRDVRRFSEFLAKPLQTEDFVVQSMPDVSPTRWHLAHTTWFFETFVLRRTGGNYSSPEPAFEVLYNSYYDTVGAQFPRSRRGVLSRPTVREVFDYRRYVDNQMENFLAAADAVEDAELLRAVELGLHHEQQHQELMLTDIKHVFSCNPLFPTYREDVRRRSDLLAAKFGPGESRVDGSEAPAPPRWIAYGQRLAEIGHVGEGFAFDHESPRHRVFLQDYALADCLVTNFQYAEFIRDGGYRMPQLWLAEGWATVQEQSWSAPLYWRRRDGQWMQFTLHGLTPVAADEPVCHVSYFEADAFARWAGARLPTEAEWEAATASLPVSGHFAESGIYHPQPAAGSGRGGESPQQMFGDLWQWTASAYSPYPGYVPLEGALGEYNGKFMCNQFVLRGASCATPRSHIRPTYRNFFPPQARWQFTGIRLAK